MLSTRHQEFCRVLSHVRAVPGLGTCRR
jgi:hypothetical protein